MPLPSIYLDECVDHHVVPFLMQRGIPVVTAQSVGVIHVADDDQLRYATTHRWTILTTNSQDFRIWHRAFRQAGWEHAGIIIVPHDKIAERFFVRCAMVVNWIAIAFESPRSQLFRWNDLQQSLLKGYVLDEYSLAERNFALGRTL